MKPLLIFFLLVVGISFTGCLVGHKIVYIVDVNKGGPGTATVWYTDIRSDALNDKDYDEDRTNLFDYMLTSDKFVQDMKAEGKSITSRELTLDKGKLNGKAVYYFNNLSAVENLAFEDGFYYLTLALDDSVVSTNGEVIKSANYKRILWDQSINPLKFEILIEPEEGTQTRSLAQFYKQEKE
jgi:ABC-type antimicrobial peptide transport system permease subunit